MSENLINQILGLPVHERLGLIERIWDSIGIEFEDAPVHDEDRAELDRRLASLDAEVGHTWPDGSSRVRPDH